MLLQLAQPLTTPAPDFDSTFAQLFLLGVGVFVFAAGQVSLRGYLRLMRYGRRTWATIVAVRGSGEDREVLLRFVTHDHQTFSEWCDGGYDPGDKLLIVYNTRHPAHYRIGHGAPLGFLGFTILGGWLIAYALWRLIF